MYKVKAADGKEYGPVSLDELRRWVAQGRISPQTPIQAAAGGDWKPAASYPELEPSFAELRSTPPPASSIPPAGEPSQPRRNGLAVTSLILGILGFICFGFLAGVPAIICGHLAYNRTRREPARYGGTGLAMAGFILGYGSFLTTFVILPILAAMLLPALSRAKGRAQEINCVNNMKQIGLALKVWALDHGDQFPFNVHTNAGGTLELRVLDPNGFDQETYLHLLILSNELNTTKILVCPADTKSAALDWPNLQAANVSYQLHTSDEVTETNTQVILAQCPFHGTTLLVDGSVQRSARSRSGTRQTSPRSPPAR